MKSLSKKFLAIATKARQITEKFARNNSYIGDTENLECYCAIGSRILVLLAKEFNYDCTFVQGHFSYDLHPAEPATTDINHCWVLYSGHIVDITATQFGIKDSVYVVKKNDPKYQAIFQHDEFDDQWKDQNPNNYSKLIKTYINQELIRLNSDYFKMPVDYASLCLQGR